MTNLFKKVLAVIGGFALILGVIWTSIQIYNSVVPNGPVIYAQGAFYPMAIPQPLLQRRKVTIAEARKVIGYPYDDFAINRLLEIANASDSQVRIAEEISNRSNFVVVNVTNIGNREAVDLHLELPTSGLCEIRKVEQAKTVTFDKTVEIGNLRPRNTASVTVWPTNYFSEYEGRSVRVTHANGVEDIEFAIALNGKSALPFKYPTAAWTAGTLILLGVFLLGVRSAGRVVRIPYLRIQSTAAADGEPVAKEEIVRSEEAKKE